MAVQEKTKKPTAEESATEIQAQDKTVENITEQVGTVRKQLANVFADEESLLMKLLKETENLTRSTINIEIEIKRQRELGADLSDANKQLARELESLDNQNTTLLNNQKEIEKEHKKLLSKNQRIKADIDNLNRECSGLEKELKGLQDDVNKLESKNTKLRDDVERLQKLKEEYMKSIAKFKEMRDELIP